MRVIVSIARSRSSGCTGAKPKPQLPITTEVMPCQPDSVQIRIPEELRVVMRVQVDKARRDDQAVGIDHLRRFVRRDPADLGDLAVLDSDVVAETRGQRAVDDHPAFH